MAGEAKFDETVVGTYMRGVGGRAGKWYFVPHKDLVELEEEHRQQVDPYIRGFDQANPVTFSDKEVIAVATGPKLDVLRACDGQESDSE